MTDRKDVKMDENCGCTVRGTCPCNPCVCKDCVC